MARRRSESLSWSLKDADPAAIPNARIALALMRVRVIILERERHTAWVRAELGAN